jgi:ribosomal subunit interface protein
MKLEITYRDIDHSQEMEDRIRAKAQKLARFHDRITACRVVVESPHNRHHKGNHFRVSIDISVPGTELVVSREPAEHAAHEDIWVTIRDAFEAAQRQLQDHVNRGRATGSHRVVPMA